jgi:hypothetical protein
MIILKINSLPSRKEQSWLDRDYMMTHCCFQLLVDWVEQEGGLEHCNYVAHKDTVDVLRGLYDWWKSYAGKYDSDFEGSEDSQAKLELLVKHRQFLWT